MDLKKTKKPEPDIRIQDAADAKMTSSSPLFAIWAERTGEKEPASAIKLAKRSELDRVLLIKRNDLPELRKLLDHFENTILPKLDKYGIDLPEEE